MFQPLISCRNITNKYRKLQQVQPLIMFSNSGPSSFNMLLPAHTNLILLCLQVSLQGFPASLRPRFTPRHPHCAALSPLCPSAFPPGIFSVPRHLRHGGPHHGAFLRAALVSPPPHRAFVSAVPDRRTRDELAGPVTQEHLRGPSVPCPTVSGPPQWRTGPHGGTESVHTSG